MSSFTRYALITGLSFVINLGLTVFLTEVIIFPEEASYAVALVTVFLINFFFMRYYIYVSHEGSAKRQFMFYMLSVIGFRGLEYISFLMIHTWLSVQYTLAIIEIHVCSAIVKFFYYKVVVFRHKQETVSAVEE